MVAEGPVAAATPSQRFTGAPFGFGKPIHEHDEGDGVCGDGFTLV